MLALWIPTLEGAAAYLVRSARPDDVLLLLGAGDIDRVPGLLARGLATATT